MARLNGNFIGSKFFGRPAQNGNSKAQHSTVVPGQIKEEKAASSKPESKTLGSLLTLSRSNSGSSSPMDLYSVGNRLQGTEIGGGMFIGKPADNGKAKAQQLLEDANPNKEEKAGPSKPRPTTLGSLLSIPMPNSGSSSSSRPYSPTPSQMEMYSIGNQPQGIHLGGDMFMFRPTNPEPSATSPAVPRIEVPRTTPVTTKRNAIGNLGTKGTIGVSLLAVGTLGGGIAATVILTSGKGDSSDQGGAP